MSIPAPPSSEPMPAGAPVTYGNPDIARPATYGKAEDGAPVNYAKTGNGTPGTLCNTPEGAPRMFGNASEPAAPYTYGDKPPHIVDDEEKAYKRNMIAGVVAMAAGICFLIGGVNGAGLWKDIGAMVAPQAGDLKVTISSIFMAIAAIATLGGVLVIGGGAAIAYQHLYVGKFLSFIGGGTGLTGLVLSVGIPVWQGALGEVAHVLAGLISFNGLGTVLAITAGFLTKLPVPVMKMLKGKR